MTPWLEKTWCIPPKADAEFVSRMEDILDLYSLPYDAKFPLVCMDEACKQLIGETRQPIPMKEGQPVRHDYEYVRNGVSNQILFFDFHWGWRHVFVRERRTKIDWALCVREILDVHYPDATKVRLVLDNLNTHTGASLYEAFPPEEARRLLKRIEFHYTPKHGSWLNMAEVEIGIMNRQCLNRRIDNLNEVEQEVNAWQEIRNEQEKTVRWTFTVSDARVKLSKIYPPFTN